MTDIRTFILSGNESSIMSTMLDLIPKFSGKKFGVVQKPTFIKFYADNIELVKRIVKKSIKRGNKGLKLTLTTLIRDRRESDKGKFPFDIVIKTYGDKVEQCGTTIAEIERKAKQYNIDKKTDPKEMVAKILLEMEESPDKICTFET